MTAESVLDPPARAHRPSSFADWRARLDRHQIAPVIAVAGSRGKTSVLRAVESIFRAAGFRIALWTDHGVEIEGERQRGELGPWSRVMTRLRAGGLDAACREIDWATFQAIGAAGYTYPVVAVTNLCANSEACLLTPEMLQARKSLDRVGASIAPAGCLILNADDFAVSESTGIETRGKYLVGMSPDTPVLRRHLEAGGDAAWVEDATIWTREDMKVAAVTDLRDVQWTGGGTIRFAVQNALFATAIARGCGFSRNQIATGLADHRARPEMMPGSFNVFHTDSGTVVVDQPAPSWFLRTSLRAAGALGAGRQLRVAGHMANVPSDDLQEVGRLLGRGGGALIIHGDWDPDRLALLRQGASGNGLPPIVLQAPNERSAIQQGLSMVRPGDVMLVLAEDPAAAVRLVDRRLVQRHRAAQDTAGAA